MPTKNSKGEQYAECYDADEVGNLAFHTAAAYDYGYADSRKDAVEKVKKFWKDEVITSLPPDICHSWAYHKLEELVRFIE